MVAATPGYLRGEIISYRFPAAIARTRENFTYGGNSRHPYKEPLAERI